MQSIFGQLLAEVCRKFTEFSLYLDVLSVSRCLAWEVSWRFTECWATGLVVGCSGVLGFPRVLSCRWFVSVFGVAGEACWECTRARGWKTLVSSAGSWCCVHCSPSVSCTSVCGKESKLQARYVCGKFVYISDCYIFIRMLVRKRTRTNECLWAGQTWAPSLSLSLSCKKSEDYKRTRESVNKKKIICRFIYPICHTTNRTWNDWR